MENKTEVENKVFMENEGRKVLNYFMPKLSNIFKDYAGKKVLIADYSLIKELKTKTDNILKEKEFKINPLKEGDNAKINVMYLKCSEYNIYLQVSLCFSGGNYEDRSYYCIYREFSSYIISVKNREFEKLIDYEARAEIDIKQELEVYLNCMRLKEELEKEKDKLKLYDVRSMI